MVTRKQLEEAFDNNRPFKTTNVDHDLVALTLLRERIPYEVCKNIIGAAKHEQIYLCDLKHVLPHISVEDIEVLADCNCFIDSSNDCLSLFI